LLKRQGGRLSASPLDAALAELHRAWEDFFPRAPQRAAQ
jgi:hypothetical protein